MIWTGKTVTGKRPQNEDTYAVGQYGNHVIAAVSDGMGGHQAGEVASRIAIDTLCSVLQSENTWDGHALGIAFSEANRIVCETANSGYSMRGMGATLVCAIPFADRFWAANVGDSRLYLLHEGQIRQVSHDHSYVAELVRRKIITEEEAKTHPRRNLITRAIGADPDVRTDLFFDEWSTDDVLLLCSDGLSGSVSEAEMVNTLLSSPSLETACAELIERALENGSSDNITAVLVKNTEDAR